MFLPLSDCVREVCQTVWSLEQNQKLSYFVFTKNIFIFVSATKQDLRGSHEPMLLVRKLMLKHMKALKQKHI